MMLLLNVTLLNVTFLLHNVVYQYGQVHEISHAIQFFFLSRLIFKEKMH